MPLKPPLAAKATLETLPYDIHHELLKYIDPATSASLAVACPNIYHIHRHTHGSVKLKTIADTNRIEKYVGASPLLCELLKRWMRKRGLKFSWWNERFVGLERWKELEELRWAEEEERVWGDGWESS